MTLQVTIDIFSGKANPVLTLTGREARKALAQLRPRRRLKRDEARLPPWPTLGYRGLIVEQIDTRASGLPRAFRFVHGDLFGPGLAHRASDDTFEDFVLSRTEALRKLGFGRDFRNKVLLEINRFRELRGKIVIRRPTWPKRNPCQCAPLYEPAWWNVPQRQPNNNCYNYATNDRTDSFAQPGRAAGAMYTALTCSAVRPAAVADALVDSPGANNKCPAEGHLVALVIWPGVDFHWYRKGRNAYWSHKPGSTPVTNVDDSGLLIPDPRTANRGPYTDFCTFMIVMHGHIKIN